MDNLILFLFGLIIGSFLNVIIDRFPKILGRSHCSHCHKTLRWMDLIPVLSFIILKRKCRYCQNKLSWQYPLVELATGILFVLFGFNIILIFIAVLIIIFVYDAKHMLVPDLIVIPAIILAFIIWPNNWPSALIASGFFAFLVLLSKETWMGWGDVEIGALMGFLLGWPNILLALLLAFLIGSIYGIILIGLKKKKLKSAIPFGPFLVIATIICLKLAPFLLLKLWWLSPLLL